MSAFFEPFSLGHMRLPQRVVMAPMTRNRCAGNVPRALVGEYYTQRASAGLIVSEGIAISHQAQGYAEVPGLYTDEQLEAWRSVVDAVHTAGGRIVAQLWHVGRVSHDSLQPGGKAPLAPSAITANTKTYLIDAEGNGTYAATSEPRAMSADDISQACAEFTAAARNARACGFDAVEIQAGNGYLIDQFLKSGSNRRDDSYGGSIENRVRFLGQVVGAVVEAVGAPFVGVHLSPVSPSNDVADVEPQALFDAVARVLARHDLLYLHIVQGKTGGDRAFRQGDRDFDYALFRQAYRDAGGKGAWMLNNGFDGALADEVIARGEADLVSFARHYIANPDLAERLRDGLDLAEPDRSTFYGGGAKGYTDYPPARRDDGVRRTAKS
jgi:N-ethylmaleimide reductase